MLRPAVAALLIVAFGGAAPAAQREPPADVDQILARVGARILEWYARAQSIVSLETVRITPLRHDMGPAAPPRWLEYELRVEWMPGASPAALPEPSVVRHVLEVNGRAPRPDDEPGCMDPKPVSPEPLMMLLPKRRHAFAFTLAGTTEVDGRPAVMLDFKGIAPGEPEIAWTDACVTVSLPGRSLGRIWIDAATYDVLRLDERLMGQFGFDVPKEQRRRGASPSMLIERADTSIRYRRVEFQDPVESLMLPAQIETVTIIRGRGTQRTRISQRFSDYKRFLADARVIP